MADETNLMSKLTKGASVVTLEVGDRDLKNFHQWVYPIISKLAEEAD
jgi:hypothetical protein